jgi:hypothetical protein
MLDYYEKFNGPPQDTSIVIVIGSLAKAREVLYAISVGLRFLFYWLFVAQPPREPLRRQDMTFWPRNLLISPSHQIPTHNGSWSRWGISSFVLGWLLLGMSLTIFMLQVLWRLVVPFRRFSAVYIAENTIQAVASALLIIKLLLNTLIPETPSRWGILTYYGAIIFALAVNMVTVIINLVQCRYHPTRDVMM